jgi:hypothetical protein
MCKQLANIRRIGVTNPVSSIATPLEKPELYLSTGLIKVERDGAPDPDAEH